MIATGILITWTTADLIVQSHVIVVIIVIVKYIETLSVRVVVYVIVDYIEA